MRIEQSFIADIKYIMQTARRSAYAAVNFYMVKAYWKIGERIVIEEQKGAKKAEYGTFLIRELSKSLKEEFGRGFSEVNLRNFRKFYTSFQHFQIRQTVSAELHYPDNQSSEKEHIVSALSDEPHKVVSLQLRKELTWSHYQLIMRVENLKARQYYMNEAADRNWSVRVLQRNINTLFYERTLSTNSKEEALKKAGLFEKHSPTDFIKDPYILEFLNIPQPHTINERELEGALIENLKEFLVELGKGFAFVGRQFRVNTETKNFYIDLVFYNHILKCFVLVDLKTGELTHQDIGQMDMYVRMFDDLQRDKTDNPTIGIILCTSRDATIVKYSVLKDNEQLFATKYKSCLPSEQELVDEIERNRHFLEQQLKTTDFQ